MNKIKNILKVISLILTLSFLTSCEQDKSVSIEEDTAKILALHHAQRGYHFNKDSIAFANQLSENFISINRGKITHPKKEETISRYNGYFSSVEFLKWDDVSEPIIKFSDDASMAYTIVDKIVTVSYQGEKGNIVTDETHFVWTTIYKKNNGIWKIDCVTSTNKPIPTK
ncbi:MAG: nuclear transport factor 2 family protein [Flavobacteriaceae bacterium]